MDRLLTRDEVMNSQVYAPIRSFLHHKYLWSWQRRSVGRACVIGIVGAFTPWPLQMIQCAVLAVVFKAHLPLSVGLVWITNPVTIPIFLVVVYYTGATILGKSLDVSGFTWSIHWFYENIGNLGLPILLGCAIHAVFWGFLLRAFVLMIWRRRISSRWLRRSIRKPL